MIPRKSFEMTVRQENRLWWRNLLLAPLILARKTLINLLFMVADIASWLGLWLDEHLPGYRF